MVVVLLPSQNEKLSQESVRNAGALAHGKEVKGDMALGVGNDVELAPTLAIPYRYGHESHCQMALTPHPPHHTNTDSHTSILHALSKQNPRNRTRISHNPHARATAT